MKHRGYKGFTLLELITAAGVLVIAISGILLIFINLFSLNENARNLSLAMAAIQDKLEEIKDTDFDTILANYNQTRFDPNGFIAANGEGAVYVTTTSDPDLLSIYISVSWRGKRNRVTGEDVNMNGSLDSGEDTNPDNRLNSPAEVSTLIARNG